MTAFAGTPESGGEADLEHLRARMSELPGSCVHAWLGDELIGQACRRLERDMECF